MTAISFFSYKGGVGRTMALANIAKHLVEFGKSVFIIDFDLEAPGVPFKLKNYMPSDQIQTGVVDYIYEFSSKGQIDDLKKYVQPLRKNNSNDADMWFLPAGNSNIEDYWNKLSRINWHEMFYTEGGKGLRFFLDLKEKIRKEYNPDFLLIDSRTGITELSGISLKILADEVVILFVYNDENIFGTEKVLSFLNADNNERNNRIKTHLVLTRIANQKKGGVGFNQEYRLLQKLKKQFATQVGDLEQEISVIHTDDSLQMNEHAGLVRKRGGDSAGIYSEHMKFFEKIFKEKFTVKEWEKQENKIKEEEIFNKALRTNDPHQKIGLLNEAIELGGEKWNYFLERGDAYFDIYDLKNAKQDFEHTVKLNNNSGRAYFLLAFTYYQLKDFKQALVAINKTLALEPTNLSALSYRVAILIKLEETKPALAYINEAISKFPNAAELLNGRANIYRQLGLYEEAQKDIFKAIELEPEAVYYATLAEIYVSSDKVEEFYLTLTTALSKGLTLDNIRDEAETYEKFRNEDRFIELLKSYNINSEDIFHYGPPQNDGHFPENSEEGDGFLNLS
jgi:tetratricopeptide (TPR) repeat protein